MFHPELGRPARLLIAFTVFIPSLSAGYGVAAGLMAAGTPEAVAAFPALVVALVGILVITYGVEAVVNRRARATA